MAANELFGFSELQQKAIRLYVAQQIAAIPATATDAASVTLASEDFTETNVKAALEALKALHA